MNSKWRTAIIWLVGIAIVAVIVVVGMKDSFVRLLGEEKPGTANSGIAKSEPVEIEEPEPIDVEEYYKEKSTVVASYEAGRSEHTRSEGQAIEDMQARGFEQYPVTYEYSQDGTYVKEQEAANSNEQHPIYQTFYFSANEELWTIIEINGSVIANPVSYNMQSERGVQLVISESEVITGYDSSKNTFYETVPNASELIVHVVERIDANTLDSLTVDVLGGL